MAAFPRLYVVVTNNPLFIAIHMVNTIYLNIKI